MKLPPQPKWNSKTDDIDSAELLRRSLDHERSLLPASVLFPRIGQTWEAIRDCEVRFQVWFTVSASGGWFPQLMNPPVKKVQSPFAGGKVGLKKGERVRIQALDDTNRPLQVTFVPVRYDQIHEVIVPEDEPRQLSRYVLTLRTAYTAFCSREERTFFHELFRLVEDVA